MNVPDKGWIVFFIPSYSRWNPPCKRAEFIGRAFDGIDASDLFHIRRFAIGLVYKRGHWQHHRGALSIADGNFYLYMRAQRLGLREDAGVIEFESHKTVVVPGFDLCVFYRKAGLTQMGEHGIFEFGELLSVLLTLRSNDPEIHILRKSLHEAMGFGKSRSARKDEFKPFMAEGGQSSHHLRYEPILFDKRRVDCHFIGNRLEFILVRPLVHSL